jgi:putative modified peptide
MAKTLPAKIADKLLDRLSSDDDFRSYFKKDPRGALSMLGYDEPAGTPTNDSALACMQCESMPTKATFTKSRAAYKKHLTSKVDLKVFVL